MRSYKSRDAAGRYAHEWGWQGFDATGREWSACNICGRWRNNRSGRIFELPPPALRPAPGAIAYRIEEVPA